MGIKMQTCREGEGERWRKQKGENMYMSVCVGGCEKVFRGAKWLSGSVCNWNFNWALRNAEGTEEWIEEYQWARHCSKYWGYSSTQNDVEIVNIFDSEMISLFARKLITTSLDRVIKTLIYLIQG